MLERCENMVKPFPRCKDIPQLSHITNLVKIEITNFLKMAISILYNSTPNIGMNIII